MKYIIGIDGGGTKTLGVLYTEKGEEVKRVKNGFSNFSVDRLKSRNNIMKTIDELLNEIDIRNVLMIECGIAGYTNFDKKEELLNELRRKYPTKISLGTDAHIAYYSVKKESSKDVIMILGGTGSVITYEQNHEVKYIGGFGHILGDKGSGYHLVITALKNIIKQHEEKKPITHLTNELLNKLNMNDYNDIKHFVYNNTKSDIASLSEFIALRASNDDREAINLFINEAVYLAEQAMNAYKIINKNEEVIIGLKGGFLLEAPYVKETLIKELNKYGLKFQIDDLPEEPVKGAYYLALKHLSSKEVA